MFINQLTKHVRTGAAIKSSPLRSSKRLDSVRIVTVHEHDIDDVEILPLTLIHNADKKRYAYQEAHDMLGVPKTNVKQKPSAGGSRFFPPIDRTNVHSP